MNFIFSDGRATLDGLGDQRNGSMTSPRKAVICGRGLKNELYILQNEEASTNVIHGTSPAAAHATRENHPSEENWEETSAINEDHEHSACLPASPPEAKIELLSKELELLQEENRRTKAAASSESLIAKRELKKAKLKIKQLKRRLRASRVQAKKKMEAAKESEEIVAEIHRKMKELEDLQNTVDMLEKANLTMKKENMELEQRIESTKMVLAVVDDPQVIGRKMKELEDLEDAAEELGRTNLMMKQENKELEQRMESAKMRLSVLENPPSEALEEIDRLRESNAKLQKKIAKFEAKQKADAEELSQLRWFSTQLSEELFCKCPTQATTKTGSKDRHKQQQQQQNRYKNHQQQPELSDSKIATTGRASLESNIDYWRKLKLLGKFKSLVMRKNCMGGSGSGSFEQALLDSGVKAGGKSAPSSICSDERLSTASSCETADDQSVTSPVEGSRADADERWSSNSAWINGYGASHGRYAAKAK